MTQKEIKEIAQRMEKGEINLVDWVDNQLKELSKDLGLELQMTDHPNQNKKETTQVSGTITFLKGESAKKAEAFFKKKKWMPLYSN